MTYKQIQSVYQKNKITVEGEYLPLPAEQFRNLRFPKALLHFLQDEKGFRDPTAIQMQGLPSILEGRDLIGISHSGTGKSMVFTLPIVMKCIQEEMNLPILKKEGPLGLIMVPSRELAYQIYDSIKELTNYLQKNGFPKIRSVLCIGGLDIHDQEDQARRGVHIVIATPGRLSDFLKRNKLHLDECHFIAFDEVDRLLESTFDDALNIVMDYLPKQRQTCMFSSSLAPKVVQKLKHSLNNPVVVTVGRPGSANMNIIQEIEYIK